MASKKYVDELGRIQIAGLQMIMDGEVPGLPYQITDLEIEESSTSLSRVTSTVSYETEIPNLHERVLADAETAGGGG